MIVLLGDSSDGTDLDRHALYEFSAADAKTEQLKGNKLIMWRAIRWFGANNYQALNLGRPAPDQTGPQLNELGFGAREHSITYCKYGRRSGAFRPPPDLKRGRHAQFFQGRTSTASRCPGSLVYRQRHAIAEGLIDNRNNLNCAVEQVSGL